LWADVKKRNTREDCQWSLGHAMAVGLAQALALIPGTSRSGITITAGLMLGYSRREAARFSFLLSIPVIALAGGLKIRDLIAEPQIRIGISELAIGYILSALSAYVCIHYFLRFIERTGMLPFVIYRLALGAVLLTMV
jgi:undecaprenyl-diphosphatase